MFYYLQIDIKESTDYIKHVSKSVNMTGILRKHEMKSIKERLVIISHKITAMHD